MLRGRQTSNTDTTSLQVFDVHAALVSITRRKRSNYAYLENIYRGVVSSDACVAQVTVSGDGYLALDGRDTSRARAM